MIFQSWLNHHKPSLSGAGTGKRLFRLLFPHEGSRRRYGLKETKLALELERILGLSGLRKWDSVCWDSTDREEGGTGCLGKEVEVVMKSRVGSSSLLHVGERDEGAFISDPQLSSKTTSKSRITISEVDSLLDQLASLSAFSQLSQPGPSTLTCSAILTRLYRDSGLSPHGSAVLTQIILRDLRPLLSPLPKLRIRNPTSLLRLKSTEGPEQLSLYEAMRCWDPRMLELYKGGKGSLDYCADAVESAKELGGAKGRRIPAGPVIGVNVPVRRDSFRLCQTNLGLGHIVVRRV